MEDPDAPGVATDVTSAFTRSVLAPNPGPMTLDGTNGYVIAAPDAATVVIVDPGPLNDEHVARLVGSRPVELVLLTHHHIDHTGAAPYINELTGAPVRALSPAECIAADPLIDGEMITAAGVRIEVVATPGHSRDSVCFFLPDDGIDGTMLTGDTLLGHGSTLLTYRDGDLGDYLTSLDRLQAYGGATVLPGHGPVLPNLDDACKAARIHRQARLASVREALDQLGAAASAEDVADIVYADTAEPLRKAALNAVRSQLAYLRGE